MLRKPPDERLAIEVQGRRKGRGVHDQTEFGLGIGNIIDADGNPTGPIVLRTEQLETGVAPIVGVFDTATVHQIIYGLEQAISLSGEAAKNGSNGLTEEGPDMPSVKDLLKGFLVSARKVTVRGEEFPFWVVRQELETRLQGFVGFNTTDRLGYVAETVTDADMEHWIRHEVLEFVFAPKEHIPAELRCYWALQGELAEVPPALRPFYIKRRRDFFGRVITYCTDIDRSRGTAFVRRLLLSYEQLCRMCFEL